MESKLSGLVKINKNAEMHRAEPYVGEDGIYMPVHEYIYEDSIADYKLFMTREIFQEAFKEYIQKEHLI